mmetsp:Transcript_33581/g.73291  ORF Transcript_33581/g.73291 Transcript_33581/m.73291 type:complete len:261 (+) Transcript_33581:332-1114(+)
MSFMSGRLLRASGPSWDRTTSCKLFCSRNCWVTFGPKTKPIPRSVFSLKPLVCIGSDHITSEGTRLDPCPSGSSPPDVHSRKSSRVPTSNPVWNPSINLSEGWFISSSVLPDRSPLALEALSRGLVGDSESVGVRVDGGLYKEVGRLVDAAEAVAGRLDFLLVGLRKSPPWSTRTELSTTAANGSAANTVRQREKRREPWNCPYFVSNSFLKPYAEVQYSLSWFPRIIFTQLGSASFHASIVKSTSAPQAPRSTKSPLKM